MRIIELNWNAFLQQTLNELNGTPAFHRYGSTVGRGANPPPGLAKISHIKNGHWIWPRSKICAEMVISVSNKICTKMLMVPTLCIAGKHDHKMTITIHCEYYDNYDGVSVLVWYPELLPK